MLFDLSVTVEYLVFEKDSWEFEVGTKNLYMRPLILGKGKRTDR